MRFRIDPTMQQKLDDLSDKANEGQLTESERLEYVELVDAIDFIGIVQGHAREVLARRNSS
jgi:hypothetical protein